MPVMIFCSATSAVAAVKVIMSAQPVEPANPLWNSYPVAEGRWIMVVMIDPNRYWEKFCAAVDLPELTQDERFADPFVRNSNSRELVSILDARFAEMAEKQGMDVNRLKQMAAQQGWGDAIEAELLDKKALDFLASGATVEEEEQEVVAADSESAV